MVRVNDKLANDGKPDPDDPADRAAVDAHFDGLSATLAEHPPEDRAFFEDDYVAETGMLPAALSDSLTAGMLSEDPAAQVAAARRLVAFEDADPALTAEIPGDQLARARTINAFTLPGLTPARIVQLADEGLAQQKAEAAQKAQVAEDELSESDTPDILDRLRELLFGGPAAAQSPGPTPKDVEALVKSDLSDKELIAKAEELGLDADVVRLLRRMLNVTPESRKEVESEINKIFANELLVGPRFIEVLDGFAETDDQVRRDRMLRTLLANAIKGSRQGFPTVEQVRRGLLSLGRRGGKGRSGRRSKGRAPQKEPPPTQKTPQVPPKPKKGGDPGKSEKGGTGGTPQATPITIRSRLAEIPFARRQAKRMGEAARRDVENLKRQLAKGNLNPGKGTRTLGDRYFELRGQTGRVIVKDLGNNRYEVVGEFQGHKLGDKANSEIINRLIEEHKNLPKGSQR